VPRKAKRLAGIALRKTKRSSQQTLSGRDDEPIRGGEILFLSPRPIFSDIMKIVSAYLALVALAIYLDNNPIYLPFNF
jgi:hypothetical protein